MITKPKVQKIRVSKWLEDIGGGTASTYTLDAFAGSTAMEIPARGRLEAGEEALLLNYRNRSGWCLLTTKRLVWFQGGTVHAISWSEIVLAQQPPEKAAQIIRGGLEKGQIKELQIYDASGASHLLDLEPGNAYYIFWSAILAFSNLSRKPDPIPLKPKP